MNSLVCYEDYVMLAYINLWFLQLLRKIEDTVRKEDDAMRKEDEEVRKEDRRLSKFRCSSKSDIACSLADMLAPPSLSRQVRTWNNVNMSWVFPVGQPPPTKIAPLSKALLEKLDFMPPEQFIAYIFDETKMSMEQRKALLHSEKYRLKTFSASWPHGKDSNLSRTKMAQAGFYFIGQTDHVSCAFCSMDALHRWTADDDPMVEHGRENGNCNFVIDRENCGNIVFNDPVAAHDSLLLYGDIASEHFTIVHTELGTDPHRNTNSPVHGRARKKLGICSNLLPSEVAYALNTTRLLTFAGWSPDNPVTAEKLCNAGFYYTGVEDLVRCFFCSGGVSNWASNDDPWKEHARWHPACSFLRRMKGDDFVEEVRMTRPAVGSKTEDDADFMYKLCEKLNHKKEVICMAIARNGNRPFGTIQDMIDAIYDIEEEGVTPTIEQPGRALSQTPHQTEPLSSTQEQNQQDESRVRKPGECVTCNEMSHISVPARYVALPCGHLIWCESCKTKFCKPEENIACPFNDCKALINATIRVYFA